MKSREARRDRELCSRLVGSCEYTANRERANLTVATAFDSKFRMEEFKSRSWYLEFPFLFYIYIHTYQVFVNSLGNKEFNREVLRTRTTFFPYSEIAYSNKR